jgi:hypothetical protein
MSLQEIKALLTALKAGIEAEAVAVFDARRGDLHASSEATSATFWNAFGTSVCWDVDWGDWDRELLASKRSLVSCGCGNHSVEARLIHERWVLLVLADGPLVTGAGSVVSHAVRILARLLPARREGGALPPSGGGRGVGGSGPAEHGGAAWWIRRRTVS